MQILGHLKNGFAGAVELINWPLYAYSTLYQAQEEQNRTVVIRLEECGHFPEKKWLAITNVVSFLKLNAGMLYTKHQIWQGHRMICVIAGLR